MVLIAPVLGHCLPFTLSYFNPILSFDWSVHRLSKSVCDFPCIYCQLLKVTDED